MGSPNEELPTAVWKTVGAYSRLLGTNFGQWHCLSDVDQARSLRV